MGGVKNNGASREARNVGDVVNSLRSVIKSEESQSATAWFSQTFAVTSIAEGKEGPGEETEVESVEAKQCTVAARTLLGELVESSDIDGLVRLVDFCFQLTQAELVASTLGLMCIREIFECATLPQLLDLWPSIWNRRDALRQQVQGTPNSASQMGLRRTLVLRAINGLLRRLGHETNSFLRGYVQLLLSYLFPITETAARGDRVAPQTIVAAEKSGFHTVSFESLDKRRQANFWEFQNFASGSAGELAAIWDRFSTSVQTIFTELNRVRDRVVDVSSKTEDFVVRFYLSQSEVYEHQLTDMDFRRVVMLQIYLYLSYISKETNVLSSSQAEQVRMWLIQTRKTLDLLKVKVDAVSTAVDLESIWKKWVEDPTSSELPTSVEPCTIPSFQEAAEFASTEADSSESAAHEALNQFSSSITAAVLRGSEDEMISLPTFVENCSSESPIKLKRYLNDLQTMREEEDGLDDPLTRWKIFRAARCSDKADFDQFFVQATKSSGNSYAILNSLLPAKE